MAHTALGICIVIFKFCQLQVPGVEADDVVGTLAVNSVSAGYKVSLMA